MRIIFIHRELSCWMIIHQIPTGSSPDTRYATFWWVGLNGVADSWMHNDVAYSYGKANSPRYDISINACSVDDVGDVDYYIDGVSYDSCGLSWYWLC